MEDAPSPPKRIKNARTARAAVPKCTHSPSEEEEEDDWKPAAKPRAKPTANARPSSPIPRRSGQLLGLKGYTTPPGRSSTPPTPPPAPVAAVPQAWSRKMLARKSVGPHGLAAWCQETRAIRRSRRIQAAAPPPSQNHPPSNNRKQKRKNTGPLTGDHGPAPMEPRPPLPPRFWAELEPRYLGHEFAREMHGGYAVAPPPAPQDVDPPDLDNQDDAPSRQQHEDKAKRGRTRKVAKRKNKKNIKPKKNPYKQIKTPAFHRLLDTKDSSHLTEVQQDLCQRWISNQTFRPMCARDGYVAPPLHPMPLEVSTPMAAMNNKKASIKKETTDPPEHIVDKHGKLRPVN